MAVNHAQRRITVGNGIHHDPKGHDVGEFFETDVLALHLAPDRKRRLLPSGDLHLEPGFSERGTQFSDDPIDEIGVVLSELGKPIDHRLPGIGPKSGERQIVQFLFQRLHADTLGERRIDLLGLVGDPSPLFRIPDEMQRPHVVQAIGELDQKHPDVVRHRQEELAEVLGLGIFGRLQLKLGQLGDPIHQPRDLDPEQVLDIVEGDAGVFDGVVEQRGGDRVAVQTQFRQNAGHLDRMGKIRITGRTNLSAVSLQGKDISAVQEIFVDARIIGADVFDQLELPHDRPANRSPRRHERRRPLSGKRLLCRFHDPVRNLDRQSSTGGSSANEPDSAIDVVCCIIGSTGEEAATSSLTGP